MNNQLYALKAEFIKIRHSKSNYSASLGTLKHKIRHLTIEKEF